MDVNLLFKVLGAALEIWASKEKTKYQAQYLKLQKEYNDETKKPRIPLSGPVDGVDYQNDALVDDIVSSLISLCNSFAYAVRQETALPKP